MGGKPKTEQKHTRHNAWQHSGRVQSIARGPGPFVSRIPPPRIGLGPRRGSAARSTVDIPAWPAGPIRSSPPDGPLNGKGRKSTSEAETDGGVAFTRPEEDSRALVGHRRVPQLRVGCNDGRKAHAPPRPKGPHYLADRRFPHTRWGGGQRGNPLGPGPIGILTEAHSETPFTPFPPLGTAGREGPD